jgi:hypothetical protein
LTDEAGVDAGNRISISETIGNVVYWLVFLLFLPAILDALNLQGMMAPVQGIGGRIWGSAEPAGCSLDPGDRLAGGAHVRRLSPTCWPALASTDMALRQGDFRPLPGAVIRCDRHDRLHLILIPVAIAALSTLNIGDLLSRLQRC